ncbi:MAG: CAP domain-containing protein [Candidatus Lustribacter sp.]|jgi:uncharacterized protein YkwD
MHALLRSLAGILTTSAFLAACSGGGGSTPTPAGVSTGVSGTPAAPSTTGPSPSPAPASTPAQQTVPVSVVDYFTAQAIGSASVSVDGAAAGRSLSAGLHTLVVTAPGYAAFNGAIQIPGGAPARTVKLFPVSPSMTAWLTQINADRAANGAGAVQLDDMLTIAAYDHAVDEATQGYFAHFDPQGFSPNTRSLLLGSMMQGLEDIAAGYPTWSGAEAAMMAERTSLPHQDAADCQTSSEALAGHYCNIVWPTHNWVGLALLSAPAGATQFGTYYDQEFGELYGAYDTTAAPAQAATGGTLLFAGANGSTQTSGYVAALPAPVPIAIATLNADPRCASTCPAADQWYPTATNVFFSADSWPFTAALGSAQLTFPELSSSVGGLFDGAAIDAVAWPGGTVTPPTYGSSAWNVTTSVARTPAAEETGRLVPNGPEMLPR